MSESYGIRIGTDGQLLTNSRQVASCFDKEHRNVLSIIEPLSLKLSSVNIDDWFRPTNYIDSTGRHLPCYDMTRDGWDLLVMGFTGDDVFPIKVAYIQSWREMEDALRSGRTASPDLMAKLEELQSLFRNGHSRANLPARVQYEHIAEVRRQGCTCPSCRDVVIVSGYGILKNAVGKAIAEFDHFYHVGKAMLTTTWLICSRCHSRLTNGKMPRYEAEPHFRAYQQLLASRQPGLL